MVSEVKDYPDYLVTYRGKIIRKWRKREIKPTYKRQLGMFYIRLVNEHGPKEISLAKIVATHFVDNPEKYTSIKFKDNNVSKIHADNLYWAPLVKTLKLNMTKAKEIRDLRELESVDSLADKYRVSRISIIRVLENETWKN